MKEMQLRSLTEADEAAMVALLRDARVAKTFMLPEFSSDAEAAELFRRLMTLSAGKDVYVRGCYAGDALVGFINQVSGEAGVVEVGYVISPDKWNHGYGTAMLSAAMEELFRLGWETVRAGYFTGNHASCRVMKKNGMMPISFTDTVTYRGKGYQCFYMEKHR